MNDLETGKRKALLEKLAGLKKCLEDLNVMTSFIENDSPQEGKYFLPVESKVSELVEIYSGTGYTIENLLDEIKSDFGDVMYYDWEIKTLID